MPLVTAWDKPFRFLQSIQPINYADIQFTSVGGSSLAYASTGQASGSGNSAILPVVRKYALLGLIRWLFQGGLSQPNDEPIEFEGSRAVAPPNAYGFELWFQTGSAVTVDLSYGAVPSGGGGTVAGVTPAQLTALSDSVDARFAAQAALIEGKAAASHTHSEYLLNSVFNTSDAALKARVTALEMGGGGSSSAAATALSQSSFPYPSVNREVRVVSKNGLGVPAFWNLGEGDANSEGRYRLIPYQMETVSPSPIQSGDTFRVPMFVPHGVGLQLVSRGWLAAFGDTAIDGFTWELNISFELNNGAIESYHTASEASRPANGVIAARSTILKFLYPGDYKAVLFKFTSGNPAATAILRGGIMFHDRI